MLAISKVVNHMQHIGVDIIEIDRIKKAIAQGKEPFLKRIYTDDELRLYHNKLSSLAARFAAKEAVFKALGIANSGISWKDIEILSDPGGKPIVNLYGKAKEQANSLSLSSMAVSISHSQSHAIAFAVGEKKQEPAN